MFKKLVQHTRAPNAYIVFFPNLEMLKFKNGKLIMLKTFLNTKIEIKVSAEL